jgi:hypothetical protein
MKWRDKMLEGKRSLRLSFAGFGGLDLNVIRWDCNDVTG